MGGKQEQVIAYIESLRPGERISVRGLSELLEVSEGTSYKAIKSAEQLGLVKTRPKAGTVRVSVQSPSTGTVTLSTYIGRMGFSVLAGDRFTDSVINNIVIGDGSVAQLEELSRSVRGSTLCVTGDRPKIMRAALGSGMHLLISGDAKVEPALLWLAEERGCCVLSSEKDSYTLLWLFRRTVGGIDPKYERDSVQSWMSTPSYLYDDDVVADLQKVYGKVIPDSGRYAVVNNELRICGVVDVLSALSSTQSQKLGNLMRSGESCCEMDESASMHEVIERMISERRGMVFITGGDRLRGIVTPNDALRYFAYRGGPDVTPMNPRSLLEETDGDGSGTRSVYMLKLPESLSATEATAPEFLYPILLSAAKRRCEGLLGSRCELESGVFYALDSGRTPGELMVSVDVIRSGSGNCALALEAYDDAACYARCTVLASAGTADESGKE